MDQGAPTAHFQPAHKVLNGVPPPTGSAITTGAPTAATAPEPLSQES